MNKRVSASGDVIVTYGINDIVEDVINGLKEQGLEIDDEAIVEEVLTRTEDAVRAAMRNFSPLGIDEVVIVDRDYEFPEVGFINNQSDDILEEDEEDEMWNDLKSEIESEINMEIESIDVQSIVSLFED